MSTNYFKAGISAFNLAKVANAEGGYNYYIRVHGSGAVLVVRSNVAETEFKYADGNYDADWAYTNRATLDYKDINLF